MTRVLVRILKVSYLKQILVGIVVTLSFLLPQASAVQAEGSWQPIDELAQAILAGPWAQHSGDKMPDLAELDQACSEELLPPPGTFETVNLEERNTIKRAYPELADKDGNLAFFQEKDGTIVILRTPSSFLAFKYAGIETSGAGNQLAFKFTRTTETWDKERRSWKRSMRRVPPEHKGLLFMGPLPDGRVSGVFMFPLDEQGQKIPFATESFVRCGDLRTIEGN